MGLIKNAAILFCAFSISFGNTQADDINKGRDVYLSFCLACHAFKCNRDGAEAYSPKLAGLIGRKAGGLDDFTGYSESLKASDIIWTEETLHSFFIDPSAVVPGVASPEFHEVEKSDQVAQLIEFLKTEDPSVDIFCTD